MGIALEEAEKAYSEGEVPVGAVVVSPSGELLSQARNQKESNFNPCGHAEILALKSAGGELQNWRLEQCTIYATLEPCPMCLGAMVHSRVGQLVFGAYDTKGGALSLNYNLHSDGKLNHRFSVIGGIRHFQCSRLLSQFFREQRQNYQKFGNS
ncbi:MAG: nucleoside deaminase [Halobacteriovoraceae bacterium]|nr:nucleoside deaminase [Halobacteriovoraceae bacterium]MBT5095258.1 nucleoside deaminase [Halobacteriovoraceae bacterium]